MGITKKKTEEKYLTKNKRDKHKLYIIKKKRDKKCLTRNKRDKNKLRRPYCDTLLNKFNDSILLEDTL